MKYHEKLTRMQVIEEVGLAVVEELERENCEFSHGVRTDGLIEFSASVETKDGDLVTAYYYQTADDISYENAGDDWSNVEFKVDHYVISD